MACDLQHLFIDCRSVLDDGWREWALGAERRPIERQEIAMVPWCAQMGAAGWVSMVAFWLVVVGLAVWSVSRLFPAQVASDPRAILESRLASGEISPETYRSLIGELDGPSLAGKEGF
ncbi:hypothetical protein [uncultured Cellulomonas sp.]|uniref:hypothetical protein n=1 Tax=uncultured Cellulomonas sp. TaxID=189682 RepID=UPI0028E7A442|nr:hypothetical protein [uncultured Cellulomonas sp.]